jgi:hypothetical protein
MTVQQVGKAIHMWLEYRITYGRRPLNMSQPGLWAAALTYAVVKVNLLDIKRANIAQVFEVSEGEVKQAYSNIVQTLDLMPGDFRYFAGENNPLDTLVEAARVLEELDRKFQADE